jgi:chaperone modulatory protein CbpM
VHEVREICELSVERAVGLLESGALRPESAGLEDWRFPAHAIAQVRRAWRLQRDLELDLPGRALVHDLLKGVDALRPCLCHWPAGSSRSARMWRS